MVNITLNRSGPPDDPLVSPGLDTRKEPNGPVEENQFGDNLGHTVFQRANNLLDLLNDLSYVSNDIHKYYVAHKSGRSYVLYRWTVDRRIISSGGSKETSLILYQLFTCPTLEQRDPVL